VSDLWRDTRDAETRPLELLQQDPQPLPASGRLGLALRRAFDPYWATVVIVSAVSAVVVALVSYSSMRAVGPEAVSEATVPRLERRAAIPLVIVQIASHPSLAQAQAAAKALPGKGTGIKILTSNGFRPLTPGYFVVYVGPFDDSEAGRAAAKRQQSRFSGALIRTITPR
jgi:SPOR domain